MVFISLRLADWILEMDFALYFVSDVVSAVGIYIYIYNKSFFYSFFSLSHLVSAISLPF